MNTWQKKSDVRRCVAKALRAQTGGGFCARRARRRCRTLLASQPVGSGKRLGANRTRRALPLTRSYVTCRWKVRNRLATKITTDAGFSRAGRSQGQGKLQLSKPSQFH